MLRIECPYCQNIVEVEKEWALSNERVFCPHCCKAYDINVKAYEEEDLDEYYGDFYD